MMKYEKALITIEENKKNLYKNLENTCDLEELATAYGMIKELLLLSSQLEFMNSNNAYYETNSLIEIYEHRRKAIEEMMKRNEKLDMIKEILEEMERRGK